MTSESGSAEERGVIFNMDGVLVDSYSAHFSAWQRMLSNHGMTMSRELFAKTFGQTNTEIFSTRYPSLDRAAYQRLSDEKETAYRRWSRGKPHRRWIQRSRHIEQTPPVAKLELHSRRLNPDVSRLQQHLVEKHYLRKHGPGTYYGQGKNNLSYFQPFKDADEEKGK